MNDIIEIYDPLYRTTNNYLLILIVIIGLALLASIILIVLKKIKSKIKIVTPEEVYNKTLDDYLIIQNKIDNTETSDFSESVIQTFRIFCTKILKKDFYSMTHTELVNEIKQFNLKEFNNVNNIFKNKLEASQYGKLDLTIDEKNEILKLCVESVTQIFNKTKEVEND